MESTAVLKQQNRVLKIAVAGNPNAGKTTIFNNLTGARQRVGNYSGVTVEVMEGTLQRGDLELHIVDLPGTYSLTAYSEEELVAREYLLREGPDLVIDVVDAANLERNLYLTTELLELGVPLILVLNMSDTARDRGVFIDTAKLAEELGAQVVPAVGNRNQGTAELIEAIAQWDAHRADLPGPAGQCRAAGPGITSLVAVETGEGNREWIDYGEQAERHLAEIAAHLPESAYRRWLSVKLLEEDSEALEELGDPNLHAPVAAVAARFAAGAGENADTVVPAARYRFIEDLVGRTCRRVPRASARAPTASTASCCTRSGACPSSWP